MTTLQESKEYIHRNRLKGVKCPCCDQLVKYYKRSISSQMALGLVELYKIHLEKGRDKWLHLPTEFTERKINFGDAQIPKLRFWNLVREQPHDDEITKRCRGYWQITGYGVQFIFNKLNVPKYIYIFNQTVYNSTDDDRVFISDCLKHKFNYEKLMQEYIEPKFEQIGMNL